jgi:hypothetical protein
MNQSLVAAFDRIRRAALIVGVAGLALCVIGLFLDSVQTLQSYLFAYLFWAGIGLGCLGLLLIQFILRGAWGLAIRRLLEAGALTLPLLAALFLPILFGMRALYAWARPEAVATDPLLQHKSVYLNATFFIVRAVIYFALWSGFAYALRRLSQRTDAEHDPDLFQRLRNLSVLGALVLAVTASFAMIDWFMSLEAQWSSTIYAMMVVAGGMLAAFALAVALLARLRNTEPLAALVTPGVLNDLGSLFLAVLLMWAYLAFSQYLVIWTGNLSDEIPWYLRRLDGGWQAVAVIIVVGHFAVPFVLLLSPRVRRGAAALALVAGIVLVMHLVDAFWLVIPALRQNGFSFAWTDVVAPVGIGGLWVAMFLWHLARSPLLPRHAPVEVPRQQEVAANG